MRLNEINIYLNYLFIYLFIYLIIQLELKTLENWLEEKSPINLLFQKADACCFLILLIIERYELSKTRSSYYKLHGEVLKKI